MEKIKVSATDSATAQFKALSEVTIENRFKGKSITKLHVMPDDEAWLYERGIMIDAYLITGASGKGKWKISS